MVNSMDAVSMWLLGSLSTKSSLFSGNNTKKQKLNGFLNKNLDPAVATCTQSVTSSFSDVFLFQPLLFWNVFPYCVTLPFGFFVLVHFVLNDK